MAAKVVEDNKLIGLVHPPLDGITMLDGELFTSFGNCEYMDM